MTAGAIKANRIAVSQIYHSSGGTNLKKLNLILVSMLGVALALACSGGGDKNTTSTNATDKKEQPANTDKTKSSDSGQDANVFTHKEGGIKFEVPNGWKAAPDGDNTENSFDAAVKELDKEVSKTIKNVKTVGKPTQDTHNGMPHYGESGTGDVNGNRIAWSVDVLSAKKPVIILSFAAPNLYEKNSADYEKLINSIRKIS